MLNRENISIVTILTALEDLNTSNDDYERTVERILSDIKSNLEKTDYYTAIFNDIEDYVSICEERMYILGIYHGIRLFNLIK